MPIHASTRPGQRLPARCWSHCPVLGHFGAFLVSGQYRGLRGGEPGFGSVRAVPHWVRCVTNVTQTATSATTAVSTRMCVCPGLCVSVSHPCVSHSCVSPTHACGCPQFMCVRVPCSCVCVSRLPHVRVPIPTPFTSFPLHPGGRFPSFLVVGSPTSPRGPPTVPRLLRPRSPGDAEPGAPCRGSCRGSCRGFSADVPAQEAVPCPALVLPPPRCLRSRCRPCRV